MVLRVNVERLLCYRNVFCAIKPMGFKQVYHVQRIGTVPVNLACRAKQMYYFILALRIPVR